MCGITGFIGKEKNNKEIIKKMTDRIMHRGPDGDGYYVEDDVALGHRRLSILDISGGTQPMYDSKKNIVVVFNGEIYNYPELKKELIKKGYHFKTKCDTEILIYGYLEWENNLPKKLRGMFSFAIYDKKKHKLFCARDPFGIKPFYYYYKNDVFMFGSEIKSFLEHPKFEKVLNKDILGLYLMYSFTPTNETFFKDVKRLDAGNYLIFENNKLTIKKYYQIKFNEKKETYEDSVKRISSVMKDSVKRHLQSDVEVGSFLSSGIDSSYIVCLAKPNKTYTVGYDEKTYSEISYAEDLSNRLKIKNINKVINKKEYLKVVPKIMYYMDEPFCDPASIALYFLSNIASKDVKVVLSGEGADEFFAGYNTYREVVDYSTYNKIPYSFRHLASNLMEPLPEFKGRNFLVRRGMKLEDSYVGINPLFSTFECHKALAFKNKYSIKDITGEILKDYKKENELNKMQIVDLNLWLVKDILHKADRMTMANSLELRVPFIDPVVFEVASSLTIDKKVNKYNTKIALRDAAKEIIPNESYKKKKLGFPVPLRKWIMEEDFYQEIKNTINQDFVKEFFNQDYAIKLLNKCLNGKNDTYKKVWAIYTFIKWYEVFFIDERDKNNNDVSKYVCAN